MGAPNLNMNGHLRATGGICTGQINQNSSWRLGHRVNHKTSWRLGHPVNQKTSWRLGHHGNQKTSWRLGHQANQKTSWRLGQVNQKTSRDLVIRIRSYQCLLQQINKNWMKD